MIKKAKDIKLNILPVFVDIQHRYYYEGPCRFGAGEALQPGYDALANAERRQAMLDNFEKYFPADMFNILDTVDYFRTDDWDYSNEQWELIGKAQADADVVMFNSTIAGDDIPVEFYERFRRPTIIDPDSLFSSTSCCAAILARFPDAELYGPEDWETFAYQMKIVRARKVLANTTVLCAVRFSSTMSLSSVDTLIDHDTITKKLGVHFRYCNVHELMDQMEPLSPEGNHCTPGRVTPNVDEEDLKELDKMADELIAGASYVGVDKQYIINSLKAWKAARKVMEAKDCNAFTIPCPDACSTRRFNEQKFTFCLTHSLNQEEGIPSACEYDVNTCLSEQALIAVSNQNPYLGNTNPLVISEGKFTKSGMYLTEEEQADLLNDSDNLYYTEHSVPHRQLKEPGKNGEYSLRYFAYDQKFGAVIRYDFSKDAGQVITLCRFSPDCSKLLVVKGEIVKGGGYERDNCNTVVVYRVKDRKDLWQKQLKVGNHLCLVYGDYTKELADLGKALGVEVMMG